MTELDKNAAAFLRLTRIIEELREQCPWDKVQTIESLRPLTIEETYELTDAITHEDWSEIQEELGDVMEHLLFYAKIASEKGKFNLEDVLNGVSDKLIARHPHIYGDVEVTGEQDVVRNWQKIKLRKESRPSVLHGVPSALPALIKASRVQEKARHSGLDFPNVDEALKGMEETLSLLRSKQKTSDAALPDKDLGSFLFYLVRYAASLNLDIEGSLEKINEMFISRFKALEAMVKSSGRQLSDLDEKELRSLWNEISK